MATEPGAMESQHQSHHPSTSISSSFLLYWTVGLAIHSVNWASTFSTSSSLSCKPLLGRPPWGDHLKSAFQCTGGPRAQTESWKQDKCPKTYPEFATPDLKIHLRQQQQAWGAAEERQAHPSDKQIEMCPVDCNNSDALLSQIIASFIDLLLEVRNL